MRKESTTIQKCNSRLTALGFNSDAAFHRSKLILKIYRDVIWVLSERAEELQETAWIMGEQDIESGLCYLENFAPDIELQAFEEKVCCLVQNQMLVNIIDRALLRLKRYPDRGELYYEILTKQFIYRFNSTEKELLEELNIERSVFYDRKREAMTALSWNVLAKILKNTNRRTATAAISRNMRKVALYSRLLMWEIVTAQRKVIRIQICLWMNLLILRNKLFRIYFLRIYTKLY